MLKVDKKIEEKVAETILQDSEKIKIGKKTYEVRPASVATLIQVSKLITKLPDVKLDMEKDEDILIGSLMIANKCEIIGQIAATLILGANKPTLTPSALKKVLKWLKISFKDKHEKLGEKILYEFSPKQIHELIISMLSRMELSFFFAITTSLFDINILRKTKGVD